MLQACLRVEIDHALGFDGVNGWLDDYRGECKVIWMCVMYVWTVGHSTREIDEFIDLLRAYGIRTLVDVRTVPRSRKNPQFNRDELERVVRESGMDYIHLKELGGLRKQKKDSVNTGWRNESFRGYADFMQSADFAQAFERLSELARSRPTAIMCAEALPWRCHRSLIADALLVRGFQVIEIFSREKSQTHTPTPFAVVEEDRITYPAVVEKKAA